jgi:hypothetical protein
MTLGPTNCLYIISVACCAATLVFPGLVLISPAASRITVLVLYCSGTIISYRRTYSTYVLYILHVTQPPPGRAVPKQSRVRPYSTQYVPRYLRPLADTILSWPGVRRLHVTKTHPSHNPRLVALAQDLGSFPGGQMVLALPLMCGC